ncbi:MAG: hypothetical protein FJ296_01465 [Planctomycetes bacterium]|nr:hypothetical protein [Planctomycetota bacterium]
MRRLHAAVAAVLAGVLAGCASTVESRAEVMRLDGQWRLGEMEEGSFSKMVEAIRAVADQPASDPARRLAVPELLRVAVKNPSDWVQHEALRAAWHLSAGLPPPAPVREDDLDRAGFNARTQRLEEIVLAEGDATSAEALELARWLAALRVPYEEVDLSVSVAEVVVSQALWRSDALGQAFADGMAGNLQHALALVTLRASTDSGAVVREEALRSVRHLHPEAALSLVAGVLARETDSAVVLAALDSLGVLAPQLPPEALAAVLGALRESPDVAVRAQVRSLLGPAAG